MFAVVDITSFAEKTFPAESFAVCGNSVTDLDSFDVFACINNFPDKFMSDDLFEKPMKESQKETARGPSTKSVDKTIDGILNAIPNFDYLSYSRVLDVLS